MKFHVLSVEDDATSRRLLARVLDGLGYTVASVGTGSEALRFLGSTQRCDLLVTDVSLPDMSGLELADRFRRERPHVPVVVLTGSAQAIDDAIDRGYVALCKPVPGDVLARVLEEALTQRELDGRTSVENTRVALAASVLAMDKARDMLAVGAAAPAVQTSLQFALASLEVVNGQMNRLDPHKHADIILTATAIRSKLAVLKKLSSRSAPSADRPPYRS